MIRFFFSIMRLEKMNEDIYVRLVWWIYCSSGYILTI